LQRQTLLAEDADSRVNTSSCRSSIAVTVERCSIESHQD
jgi:hypothetical protein